MYYLSLAIKMFSPNFVFNYDDGLSYFPVIDKWLEFSMNKKVEYLHLNIRYRIVYPTGHDQPYSLPENMRRLRIKLNISEEFNAEKFGLNHLKIKLRDLSFLNHANLDLYCDELDEINEHIEKDLLARFIGEDIDLLEDKYLLFELDIFKVPLQNLKNVKVMPFCSSTLSFDAIKLYQFLKFLLEHAINPDKLVIVREHKDCNDCSTNTSNLIKHLLDFPTSAIISFRPISHNVFYS
ncbi:hypothetical protein H5410_060727 [Solanum commersonii]|uniref:FBD domain-containing protein n=1 Tax=Solanum commersonii TaxID=4109 RepID=A0A9J5W692_SOLCO|nr:hypothetical protein H5410_060727 [Solanum commersonii]